MYMKDQHRKVFIEEKFRNLFGEKPDIWVQAPGRVDLMGSHTDYNLGYVLIQTINRSTWIAASPRTDGKIRIASLNLAGRAEFELSRIEHDTQIPWSNYVRGVAHVLLEENYPLTGFDGLVHSTIPFGSGLSSSAALEVATIEVFETLSNWRIEALQKALFCQRAENQFVGMQCGIMDQYASVMGRAGCILLLDCRSITSEIKPVAPGLQVVICDTRAERALTGSEYSQRRAQCEAGAALLADYYPGIQSLRDVSLDQLQAHQADMDPVIYKRCYFILQENQRVLDTAAALVTGRHAEAGRLAVESFNGARDLYEIVSQEMLCMFDAIMHAPGVFGARGAGAGFGGCLVAFVGDDCVDAFMDYVQHQYAHSTGIQAEIYPVRALDGAGVLNIEQDSNDE
jgi:galactokinase